MLSELLCAFFAVARQGSVALAARQIQLSQPTITSRIKQLEEQYQIELFYRGGARWILSDAGVRLMPMVERLLQEEANIDFCLRNAGGAQQGHLRIGATGPFFVSQGIARFHAAFPQIQLSMEFGNSKKMLKALNEYEIDLAVSSSKIDDRRLMRVILAAEPLVLAISSQHPLAKRAAVDMAELAGLHLLLREEGSETQVLTQAMLQQAGVTPKSASCIANGEAIRQAIIHGFGASIMSKGEVLDYPAITVLPFTQPSALIYEYLYYLKDRAKVPLIVAFLSHIQNHPTQQA
ncbi:LysR substrate-binding domain-containing protein [Iodobacter sp.]|uniref:LysR substrate-binding domain-containing protein n=1 Tax=Iodobacter sp. TaxID=1915058 RepID=UPI0025DB0863|nr:LysR substrate-binding domain-containing protein [Iodobacter sp.]